MRNVAYFKNNILNTFISENKKFVKLKLLSVLINIVYVFAVRKTNETFTKIYMLWSH